MFTRVVSEGTAFEMLDPDASMLRDALPGRGYEPAVCALLARALARPEAVFFDIGALYGYFALRAARAGDARVVAFEPASHYADVLLYNLALNECEHVRVERVALSDRTGAGAFAARTLLAPSAAEPPRRRYLRGVLNHVRRRAADGEAVLARSGHWRADPGPWLAAAIGERLGLFTRGADQDEREIRLERLDDWVARERVVPTVAKIDVHGGEVAVIRGMHEMLRRPIELIVEVHTSDLLTTGSHEELVLELEDAGLEVFELRGFRGRNGRLVPLVGKTRREFCKQDRWTALELYFMRCLYARRRAEA